MDFGLGVLLEAKDIFSGTFQKAGMAFRDVEGASSQAGQAITDNLKLLGVGMTILATGVAGLAILAPTIAHAAEFGQKIAEITTLTDEASLNTLFLSEEVMNLNAAYGGTTGKQAKALYDGISAGAANAAQGHAILTASNRLAVAGVTEVNVALDGLTSTLNAYGKSFEEAGEFSDVFMVAVQQGKTTVPELANVIGRVAPTASDLGVTFDELGASIAAVTAKGIKTEEAATGLKAAFANVLKPTSDATAEASRLGITFTAAQLRAKGFKGFLDEITSSSKFNKDSLSKLFGSVEGLNTVLALTAQGGQKFADAIKAMGDKSGAADKAFAKMEQTLAFQEKRFAGIKENTLIMIGQALEPAAAASVRLGASLLQAFNALPDGVRNFLVKGFALVSTLLTVVGGAIALRAAFGVVAAGMSAAGVSVGGLLATLLPVVGALGAIALAFYAFREAYDRNLGGVGDAVDKLFDKLRLIGAALGQAFEDGGFSGSVREELNRADNQGLKAFVIRVYVAVARIQELFHGLAEGFFDAINDGWTHFQAFMEAIDGLSEAFGGLFASIDPKDASEKFDAFGGTGRKIGAILAKVALVVVDLATTLVKLATKMVPIVTTAGSVVSALGDVEGIAKVVELVLVALAIRAIVTATAGFLELGASGVTAAIGIGRAAAAAVAMNGLSLGGVATSIATGLRGIGAAATGALGPIGAVTFALTALYAAYNLFSELDEKSHGHGFAYWWVNAKHNLGITDEDEYRTQRESLTHEYENSDWNQRFAARAASGSSLAPPPQWMYAGVDAPAVAAMPEAGSSMDDLFASMAAAQKQEPAQVNIVAKFSVDGEELQTKLDSMSRDRADRSFAPGIPIGE